ncbi:hypothetical protein DRW03_34560 [Corallococcus sp. H22C18031201]|nr:hypothetical protein DRW03_34560 [Corallococcus sp. H22C18031201]
MSQPVRWGLALALMWGAGVFAEPAPSERVDRKRTVAVAASPAEPLPVIHVAQDTPTLLLFPAPINRKTLTFDESRIRVLDAGDRSVIIQPVFDLPVGERYEIGVYFADSKSPSRAAFSLVTVASEVDTRIDVQRPELAEIECPTASPRAPLPEDFVLLGLVDKFGVTATPVKLQDPSSNGLEVSAARAFRGNGWILVDAKVRNRPGSNPWTPREALLTGRAGLFLRARVVMTQPGPILPGETGRVLVVSDAASLGPNPVLRLELEGDARSLAISDIRLPKGVSGDSQ